MTEEVNSMQGRDSPSEQQLPLEEISSALSDDQIFQLCDPNFLQETLQDSEVTSCSNFGQDNITTSNHHSLPKDHDHADIYSVGTGGATTTASSTTTAATTNTTSNPSIIFDPGQEEIENDISASINFSPSPPFSIYSNSAPQHEAALTNFVNSGVLTNNYMTCDSLAPLVGHGFQPVFEDGSLASMPQGPYMPLSPSTPSNCSFLGTGIVGSPSYLATNGNVALLADSSRMLMGSLLLNNELQITQELEYQGDNGGIYFHDSVSNVFKHNNSIQAFCSETRNLVNGHDSGSPPLANEISSLEDSTFKVGKLSVEQRKEKIHRYMKKRNERNFSKKIKYACRKTLADSRPRVRGRFAKNDDFGESHNRLHACISHEEDDKDEVNVKEENDMIDSSDIFAHISGVNSFKCNYSIQSWI